MRASVWDWLVRKTANERHTSTGNTHCAFAHAHTKDYYNVMQAAADDPRQKQQQQTSIIIIISSSIDNGITCDIKDLVAARSSHLPPPPHQRLARRAPRALLDPVSCVCWCALVFSTCHIFCNPPFCSEWYPEHIYRTLKLTSGSLYVSWPSLICVHNIYIYMCNYVCMYIQSINASNRNVL